MDVTSPLDFFSKTG